MALNAPMFQSVTAQSQEMVRQRIILEERFGRRPAQAQTPGPVYDEMIRGSAEIRDPWAPTPHENRSTIHAPVFGYSGHVPRVCPEHLPHEGRESCSEAAKSFQKPEAVRDTRDPRLTALEALSTMAPGGGAGALGTEAPVLLGTRSAPRPTAHEAYQIAKTIVG